MVIQDGLSELRTLRDGDIVAIIPRIKESSSQRQISDGNCFSALLTKLLVFYLLFLTTGGGV